MFRTLRAKLVLSYAAIALFSLLLALAVLLVLARDYSQRNGFKTLQEKASLVLPYVRLRVIGSSSLPAIRQILGSIADRAYLRRGQVRVLLLDPSTLTVTEDSLAQAGAEGKTFPFSMPRGQLENRLDSGMVQGTARIPGENAAYQFVALRVAPARAGTQVPGRAAPALAQTPQQVIVVVAQPEPQIAALLRDLGVYLLIAASVALLLSLVAAFALGRSISRPVVRLADAARAVGQGDYTHQVPVQGNDELAMLARQFNEMASEIGRAHQVQRDFIANVSHDLKTPLTSIQGFSQAMIDGATKTQEDYRQAATVINTEAQRMSRMVAELLDLTRLQNGLATMELRPTELAPLISQLVLTMQPQAAAAGVSLVARLPMGGQPILVMADADRLRQALGNLMENSIKYSLKGGQVDISLADAHGAAQLEVRDTGQGMPAEEVSRVMERFYQVDKSRSGDGRSLGLGLAIAREIVHAHRGKIEIQSRPGQGTSVRLTLPTAVGRPADTTRRLFGAPTSRTTHPLSGDGGPAAANGSNAGGKAPSPGAAAPSDPTAPVAGPPAQR